MLIVLGFPISNNPGIKLSRNTAAVLLNFLTQIIGRRKRLTNQIVNINWEINWQETAGWTWDTYHLTVKIDHLYQRLHLSCVEILPIK